MSGKRKQNRDTALTASDVRELARLRAYAEEFRSTIALLDRTPPQFRYFQTDWLMLHIRGLIAGEWPNHVQERRLRQIEEERQTKAEELKEHAKEGNPEDEDREAAEEVDDPIGFSLEPQWEPELDEPDRGEPWQQSADATQERLLDPNGQVKRYCKAEMCGGPADGQIHYVTIPATEFTFAYAKFLDGRVEKVLYRRRADAIGGIVEFSTEEIEKSRPVCTDIFEKAFRGKPHCKYYFCP